MLAQNFKPAAELGLEDKEHRALVTVLGMLERGEIEYHEPGFGLYGEPNVGQPTAFNMVHFYSKADCGTVACICGWAIAVGGLDRFGLIEKRLTLPALERLFDPSLSGDKMQSITPAQAATALRSYLTTGDARWDLAVPK